MAHQICMAQASISQSKSICLLLDVFFQAQVKLGDQRVLMVLLELLQKLLSHVVKVPSPLELVHKSVW